MARKLKTYITSAGFFDLAVAAPSMKAALEAWGSEHNLFHQGFAKVSEDPEIVAATMAKPGVVLRRPVGTSDPYKEDAELPTSLPIGRVAKRTGEKRKFPKPSARPIDTKAARAAALEYERQQKRREQQARKEDAAREKERERRDRAIAAAEAALQEAKQEHQANVGEIEKARMALDKKLEAEKERWAEKKEKLEEVLRKARTPSHLRLVW
jgi:colicin import membrane protein